MCVPETVTWVWGTCREPLMTDLKLHPKARKTEKLYFYQKVGVDPRQIKKKKCQCPSLLPPLKLLAKSASSLLSMPQEELADLVSLSDLFLHSFQNNYRLPLPCLMILIIS